MAQEEAIKLFDTKNIRTAWNEEEEKWYFSVTDVVEALTDSTNPTDYLKKMRRRDPELAKGWGQIVTPLSYRTAGGPRSSRRIGSKNRKRCRISVKCQAIL